MTETRHQEHAIDLPVTTDVAFGYLITPRDIRGWWEASSAIVLARPGGAWAATWGDPDDPDYISFATIDEIEEGRMLRLLDYRYFAKNGVQPFEAEFVVEFRIEATDSGSRLTVRHDGFPCGPEADAHFEGCDVGWKQTLKFMLSWAKSESGKTTS